MKTILSTKRLTEKQKEILNGRAMCLIEHNFIDIELLDFKLISDYNLLIFTSKNGVLSALQHPEVATLKQVPVICVGENTCRLLESNNFRVLHWTPYATELIDYMKGNLVDYQSMRIAFIAGSSRLDTLPDFFKEKDLIVDELTAYQTLLTPITIGEKIEGILFFSPSGVESYCLTNTAKNETIYCIGTTTAKAAARYWQRIILADTPTIKSVLQAVIRD